MSYFDDDWGQDSQGGDPDDMDQEEKNAQEGSDNEDWTPESEDWHEEERHF